MNLYSASANFSMCARTVSGSTGFARKGWPPICFAAQNHRQRIADVLARKGAWAAGRAFACSGLMYVGGLCDPTAVRPRGVALHLNVKFLTFKSA